MTLIVVGLVFGLVLPQLVSFLRAKLLAIGAMVAMTTAALVCSMRNPGLALKLAIVTYLLVTLLVSIPFLRWPQRPIRA